MHLPKKAAWTAALALAVGVQAEPAVHTVVIDGLRFMPDTIEVEQGDKVVWRNKDPFPHTATAAAQDGPRSPVIAAGTSWAFKAAKRGRYPYVCTLHPTMRATLIVK